MRVFASREVAAARAYALAGGLAMHLHSIIPDRSRAPQCFVRAVDSGQPIAHLFCQDATRLRALAAVVGVRVVHIDRAGTDSQHLDLCSGPLWKACKMLPPDEQEKLKTILATFKRSATA